MPATRFDGAGDRIVFDVGAALTNAAHTFIWVRRRNVLDAWHGGVTGEGLSSSQVRASAEDSIGNYLVWSSQVSGGSGTETTGIASATDWFATAIVKPASSGSPVMYSKNITTDSAIASETSIDTPTIQSTAALQFIVGLWNNSDDFDGWFACAAFFNVALTSGQIAECFANRRTSDIYNCSANANLVALWEFNTPIATLITDLSGNNADEQGRTGTSLDTGETPPWTFDATGAAGHIFLPDADIVTTGWTTTPLHSKLADASDASVITATLA